MKVYHSYFMYTEFKHFSVEDLKNIFFSRKCLQMSLITNKMKIDALLQAPCIRNFTAEKRTTMSPQQWGLKDNQILVRNQSLAFQR